MSIFGFFKATDEQETTSTAYQSWRDQNPDNPSDDDFYLDSDDENPYQTICNSLSDSAKDYLEANTTTHHYGGSPSNDDEPKKGWFRLW